MRGLLGGSPLALPGCIGPLVGTGCGGGGNNVESVQFRIPHGAVADALWRISALWFFE